MLQANSDTSFYLNGELVDTVMLDYEIQSRHNGAKFHKARQAVAKLRILSSELQNGYTPLFGEEIIQKWVRECQ